MEDVKKIGFYSAVLAAFFAIAYSIPELFNTFGFIPFPQNLVWLFIPSLLLGPSFLITMICTHYSAPPDKKIWTGIGIAFAIIYCTFITMVYFSQLGVVIPQLMDGSIDENHILAFKTKSFLMAVDCLGYTYMGLSTLFASFAFKERKWAFISLFWNGLTGPLVAIIFFFPDLIYFGAIWMITFPMAMINLAKMFKKNSNNLK